MAAITERIDTGCLSVLMQILTGLAEIHDEMRLLLNIFNRFITCIKRVKSHGEIAYPYCYGQIIMARLSHKVFILNYLITL